ncbi:DUF6896 domain-containing protein [Serratia sp. (in: enterobacteria)]|uniref:DUF6896 domain-containing protein n=1 Tax=Serratia sp. (in: enterobacteria) TaxID=616 RepID=UPI00398A2D6B
MRTNVIKYDDIFCFQKLQAELLNAFFEKYNDVNDFEKLMDFPRRGDISLSDGSHWLFTKHGFGIRFKRVSPKPNTCVDVHTHVKKHNLITLWRLSSYFSSLGNEVSDEDIESLVKDMELQGIINKISGGYILN